MHAPKRYHTAAEVAEYLGLRDASAVRRYARLGLIPSVQLGHRLLFKLEDIDHALEESKTGGGASDGAAP